MHAPDVSRRTEVLEGGGDLGVAFVVDPHEAELDQASTEGDLGVDDFAGVGEFHGERLLGEDRQAAFEAGHHVAVMEAVRAGDHQRVAVVDAIHALGHPLAAELGGERLTGGLVGVGDPGEFGAGEIDDMAGVTRPHAPDTDDTDARHARNSGGSSPSSGPGRGSAATPRMV